MKFNEILKENKVLGESLKGPPYNVKILSNIILSPIKDILEYSVRKNNITAQVGIGNYDNIMQESEKYSKSNLIIIFWELFNLIEGGQYKFDLMTDIQLNQFIDKMKSEIDLLFNHLKETPLVLINSFSTLIFNYQNPQISKFELLENELNNYLNERMPNNFRKIEVDKIFAKISIKNSIDFRYFYSSKSPYTVSFYKAYCEFITPIILSTYGKSKKVLILDCDNTLWKNILGEEGLEGIEMSSHTRNGSIFNEVQSIALKLNKQGIVLGLCSKNNEYDVESVFTHHRDMVLKENNISIKRINWDNKTSNLQSIANELNIGLDSMVYIDDSDFEIELINKYLPDLLTIKVPENIFEYPKMLRENSPLFIRLSESKEDLVKAKMYHQQSIRNISRQHFSNTDEFLESLQLELYIFIDDFSNVPRLSQLTLKTNQFNLTSNRYLENDIKLFLEKEDYRILSFEAIDKFGNYGITGLCILSLDLNKQSAHIDSFLMSCRVIGRNFEFSFFDFIISDLKTTGIFRITASYIKSQKNQQVEDFFEKLGFSIDSQNSNNKNYSINVNQYKQSKINYISVQKKNII
jgi:FkbH-like protein